MPNATRRIGLVQPYEAGVQGISKPLVKCRAFVLATTLSKNNTLATSTRLDLNATKDYPEWTNDDIGPLEKQHEVRDWLYTVGLSRHEDYLIDPGIDCVHMGLGWDRGADVDASAVMCDEHSVPMDTIWYKKLRSLDGSVSHSGDNLTGIGDGDDEIITVALSEVPLNVHHILFTVCVYSHNVSFAQLRSAYVRMMHGKKKFKNHEMCHFSLTQMSGHAMLMGLLTRRGAYWNFRALGTPATGRTVQELLQNPTNLQCLSESPSVSPEFRYVRVSVIRGTGLAAKDFSGFLRRTATSDPYYVMKFKKNEIRSEHKPKTLEPEWKSPAFDVGWITESEMKPLKIQLFDYDVVGADDFMGMIRIPGHALFSLGVGSHTFWFVLGDSKKKERRNQKISGKILVNIQVEGPSPTQDV